MDCSFRDTNCWGLGINCDPPYGYIIVSKMKSVKYFHILEFLTLDLSPAWLISYYGGRWITYYLASTGSITFTLVMDEDYSILTSGIYCVVVSLLGYLMVWYSPRIVVQVKLLKDFSGIFYLVYGFYLVSGNVFPLRGFLLYNPFTPVGIQMVVYKLPWSHVRYPEFLVSHLWATLMVNSAGSRENFAPPPSRPIDSNYQVITLFSLC